MKLDSPARAPITFKFEEGVFLLLLLLYIEEGVFLLLLLLYTSINCFYIEDNV